MESKADRIRAALKDLVNNGHRIYYGLAYEYANPEVKKKIKEIKLDFNGNYEKWYSEAREVLKQLIPDRIKDFDALYKSDKRKEITFATYTVSDALIGLETRWAGELKCSPGTALSKFMNQITILESAEKAIDGILFRLRNVLQADLFDSELEEAEILNKNGFVRAAGAVAGVVLEKHLQELLVRKNVSLTKKNPSLSDLNDALKNGNAIEVKDWRFIQHLADIRNLCDHKKEREPKKEEIVDLILGVQKVIKTMG